MKVSEQPAMPVHDVMEDCGIDGNSGPFLVTRTETGLTKREYFAGLAMQGLCALEAFSEADEEAIARYAVDQADALLERLETAK